MSLAPVSFISGFVAPPPPPPTMYCSASEIRHPSEVRQLHFMTMLKSFYCPVTAYMYTLPLKEATI